MGSNVGLSWILVRVARLGKPILDPKASQIFSPFFALLHSGVVAHQSDRDSLLSKEIKEGLWAITFSNHSIDMFTIGLKAHKVLGTVVAFIGGDGGEPGVGCIAFQETTALE